MRRLSQVYGTPAGRLMPAAIMLDRTIAAPNLTAGDAEGVEPQMEQALQRMVDVLREAGATPDGVARVTAYVGSVAERDPVYRPWDRLFPDP